jgi:hypothetical protein
MDEHDEIETTECPEHGTQEVLRHSTTRGVDPYDVSHAKCGCKLVCYGPGEPMVQI